MAEVIYEQQSAYWIGDMDGYDQDGVFVQSGGVIMVKSRHDCLWEWIDGWRYFDLKLIFTS